MTPSKAAFELSTVAFFYDCFINGIYEMALSIHDNFVLGYSVDCEAKQIVIQTEYRDQGKPFEKILVRFDGVIGYSLKACLDSILFDIEETTVDLMLKEFAGDFEWGSKYGWPWPDAGQVDPNEYVTSKQGKVYRIQGQNCFDGFVVAKEMLLVRVE